MAALAGSVHGVVVQMANAAADAASRSSAGKAGGRLRTGIATYTARLTWPSGYSSSASASAVPLLGDQLTGLRPR